MQTEHFAAGTTPAKDRPSPRPWEAAGPIPCRGGTGPFPLSFAQERLYVLDRLEPASAAYNIARAIRIRGPLVVPALAKALDEVLRRHESLRVRFRETGEQIVAETLPLCGFPLSVVEIETRPGEEIEAEALRQAEEEAGRPFDPSVGPMVRARLVRLAAEDHLLVLTMHHIASDGWSIGVLYRELGALYQAFVAGGPSPLPDLSIQYSDFAHWQREWLQGEVLDRQMAYWRSQLDGGPAVLDLLTDRVRPAVRRSRGAVERFVIPRELTQELQALARREGVTLFMTILAAFEAFLSRYTGEEDIVVGTPVANRRPPETEGLIGLFVNTLAVRTDLSGDPTFRDLLGRVRERALDAFAHQDLPFEKLVEDLSPERDPGRNPLFQVLLSFASDAGDSLVLPGLEVERLSIPRSTSAFDLALDVEERDEALLGHLRYCTDLFEKATARRMVGHFRSILQSAASDPGRPLSALECMPDSERHQVLVEWNQTDKQYPRHLAVHRLFEAQAAKAPDAAAAEFGGERLTYGQLNARSNQLARYLRKRGVGPEVLVGLCVERSMDMVVGLLGILKAGGAYLPLDPTYPPERLRFMLEDSGAGVVLTHRPAAASSPAPASQTILIDSDCEAVAAETGENLESGASPSSLAYVIYTSGSTGKPKGVEIEHGSLTNLTWVSEDFLEVRPGDRVLQFASLSFDASALEIFTTLAGGGTLVLRTEEMIATVANFLARCREWNLTVLDLPAAYWHEMVAVASAEGLVFPESLRLVCISGERARREPFAQWRSLTGGRIRLLNGYGPTETTIAATKWERDGPSAEDVPRTVPIGRPLANFRAYVLDARLQPVPVGVAGELYIGGVGVARGYRNRPALTAERFIPNPFRNDGDRLYRTGDRARFGSDGILEYLGRVDGQVKLRGFRVEPGEIETALRNIAGVREAVVRAREDVPGQLRLVAYVVPEPGTFLLAHNLRRSLKQILPPHMVPSAFVVLDALPRTPNGKLDVAALPAPESERPAIDSAYRHPRTPVEEALAEIWAKVLGVDRVGVDDNFFELGGHSLLATQVISRVRDELHVELPLRDLFLSPSVAALALAVARTQAERMEPDEMERLLSELEPANERSADGN